MPETGTSAKPPMSEPAFVVVAKNPAPTNVQAKDTGHGVIISWDYPQVPGVVGFVVERWKPVIGPDNTMVSWPNKPPARNNILQPDLRMAADDPGVGHHAYTVRAVFDWKSEGLNIPVAGKVTE